MTSYIEFCIVPQQVMIYLPHEWRLSVVLGWLFLAFEVSGWVVVTGHMPSVNGLLGFWAMAISCYPKAFQTTIKLNSKVVALNTTAGGYGRFSLNSKVVALIKVAGGVGFLPFQTEKNNMSILWRQFCSFGALTYLRYHFLFGRCYFLFAVCVFVVSHRAAESPGGYRWTQRTRRRFDLVDFPEVKRCCFAMMALRQWKKTSWDLLADVSCT